MNTIYHLISSGSNADYQLIGISGDRMTAQRFSDTAALLAHLAKNLIYLPLSRCFGSYAEFKAAYGLK